MCSGFLVVCVLFTVFFVSTAVGIASLAAMGVTAGAHRLWCHRAYKAKWPLRLILCILQTVAFQVSHPYSGRHKIPLNVQNHTAKLYF